MDHGRALRLHEVAFRYPAMESVPERGVLDAVTLDLGAGELGAVVGRADAGKTTLQRVLAGLLPRFSGGRRTGSARLGARDLFGEAPSRLMDSVGLVFQDPDEQLITARCDTEVALALESLGIERAEIGRRVDSCLRLVGLAGMEERNPGTLSGGEKKRLLVACLAAAAPSLWILDEVFQELDVEWREVLLEHLRREGRTALLLDSRWSPLYARACAGCWTLREGRVQSLPPGSTERDAALAAGGFRLDGRGGVPPDRAAAGAGGVALRAESIRLGFGGPSGFDLCVDELTLRAGTCSALMGRNGSGKTTLARVLCGLAEPRSGRVGLRAGAGVAPADRATLRRRVGYLFQNPDSQVFLPSVRDELSFGLRSLRQDRAAMARSVEEAAERFRLPPLDTPPFLMSHGARRRLQAACAWLTPREVLVLDEVDSGLSYDDILPLLDALRGPDRALLLITHDPELARVAAARTIVMEGGRIRGGAA